MTMQTEDKMKSAYEQGQAQYESIAELVERLERADEGDTVGAAAVETVREEIQESPLSVQVRSGWYNISGPHNDIDRQPAEYEILLCTGGPAVRITGELGDGNEPESAHLQVQDWFTEWTDYLPRVKGIDGEPAPDWLDTLLAYARCFYFGE